MGVQGKSNQGGAVESSGPTYHEVQAQPPVRTAFQGLLRSKGGFSTKSNGAFSAQPAARSLFSWAFHP